MPQHWTSQAAPAANQAAAEQARQRQARLTKPLGSLGRLEDIAVTLAGLAGHSDQAESAGQASQKGPAVDPVSITVFAADHGVAAAGSDAGVSAYPAEVTVQMLHNFAAGGAAISVLARLLDATLEVVDVGTASDPGAIVGVVRHRAGNGSADLRHGDAMTAAQLDTALAAGRQAAERALERGARLFIGGEMGIGNSTAASALAAALLDASAEALTGPGTGLDQQGVARKAAVIASALQRHRAAHTNTPLRALQSLGGFEIAALVGAYIRCAQLRLPVLVDGFITGSAALAAVAINPSIAPWLLYSHRSAEPGHQLILAALDAQPLLDLGMRLGEGSGAAASVPLLRIAAALHNCMATFDEAGVSDGG
jgi:nicotinate-nucleotide--dimethylbenzimidazole phosphoribosyltransferase